MHYLVPSLIYEAVLTTLSFEVVWSSGCRLVNRLPASPHSRVRKPCDFPSTFALDGMSTGKASGKALCLTPRGWCFLTGLEFGLGRGVRGMVGSFLSESIQPRILEASLYLPGHLTGCCPLAGTTEVVSPSDAPTFSFSLLLIMLLNHSQLTSLLYRGRR